MSVRPDPSAAPDRTGFGIDIGGTGIKAAPVDLRTGETRGAPLTVPTPQPATPEAVAAAAAGLVDRAGWTGPVGVTLPSVVRAGITHTAANIAPSWLGVDAAHLFSRTLDDRPVRLLNDADAAGLAEARFGAAAGHDGVVLMLTFGTGIGSALLAAGVLVPNTELGHLMVDGVAAEHRASAVRRGRDQMSWPAWAAEVSRVLKEYERLLWPDLIVAGGGISAEADRWLPLLTNRTPVVAAMLENTAGIVGAAMAAGPLRPSGTGH